MARKTVEAGTGSSSRAAGAKSTQASAQKGATDASTVAASITPAAHFFKPLLEYKRNPPIPRVPAPSR